MLILLDRDGVINTDIKPHGTLHPDELTIYEFVPEAIYQLKKAGYHIAVITNQSAIEKELMSVSTLTTLHHMIQYHCRSYHKEAYIDAFYYCSDHPDRPTQRRKPNAGMIYEALHDFAARPENTVFVGDSMRDVQAACITGCIPYLVKTGNGTDTDAMWSGKKPYQSFNTLADVARALIK